MSELTLRAHDGRAPLLCDGDEVIAVLGLFANHAWATRLARVVQLEDIVRRALTVRSFHDEVAIREEMAQLAAQFETCVCRRVVSEAERCPLCAACPSCCKGCAEPDAEQGLRDFERPAAVRY